MTTSHPTAGTEPRSDDVRFRVLGPVRAWRAGAELPLGPRQQRLVLAALLARAGRPVSLTELVALLWEGDPPRSAANAVHRYVGVLRRLLEPGLPIRAPGKWLVRQGGGYLMRVGPDQLDLLAFRASLRRARSAVTAGNMQEAVSSFGAALEQWQGLCAADLEAVVGDHPLFATVEYEYIAAVTEAAEAALCSAAPPSVLLALRQAAQRHPLDERLQARLMLLLASDGRQAEALLMYRRVSTVLRDELGVEPGAELRTAHEFVLRGRAEDSRPVLATATAADTAERSGAEVRTGRAMPVRPGPTVKEKPRASSPVHPVPAQLPADLPCFTGRERAMEQALDLAGETSGALPVLAIDGIPGVGKTALAVRLAHRVAPRFTDGQLFADLGGFTSGKGPSDPGAVLYGFLEALGLPRWRIPETTDSRAALFRSVLATRRVLVVLDNALDVEQVRPLLPGAPQCMVVITSRRRLSGLAAVLGARLTSLDVPSATEATRCFLERVGAGRPDADADAVEEIVELCGRLPLALSVVAAHVRGRPDQPLGRTAAELAAVREGLDGFSDDDRGNALRAVFSWPYRTLGPDAAPAFRLLPSHRTAEFGTGEVAGAAVLSPQAATAAWRAAALPAPDTCRA
ncbi:BTAD domain-containing putative transcriptional regulator [Streptomyces mirabilis]|uniref:BTAD domain-containing putative transcriptional regulator n=1 Tax=Streptomyces mirabilis TaxID=68239 RepID=A0ABU3V583_9ACTN|nr:BTAD domain-containing putative transcriptional regulator [Streptomyces mirabilis]MCX5355684.1 NB-ARC domain-containing protein [Streptomyces mirabilis]MDU9001327.1 BTAD domain-containing putative transcriptional regulator [Streptomyces mirabilis]